MGGLIALDDEVKVFGKEFGPGVGALAANNDEVSLPKVANMHKAGITVYCMHTAQSCPVGAQSRNIGVVKAGETVICKALESCTDGRIGYAGEDVVWVGGVDVVGSG